MSDEITIHNGVVLRDGKPATEHSEPDASPLPRPRPIEQDPNEIARIMAGVISQGMADKALPMEIVNRLLQLREGPKQRKLVWTLFDVYQCFGIWSRQLAGENKL